MMKKLVIVCFLLFSAFLSVSAAGDSSTQELRFIYITNSVDTPTASLTKHLKQVYKDGMNYGYPTIFYLSNMNNSIVASIGLGRDDTKAFGEIINILQTSTYNNVDANHDLENIMDIFDSVDFLDENGKFRYQSMVWDFFINQSFWNLGYNDKIIAGLYYILDIDNIPDGCFRLRIQYSGSGDLAYSLPKPFGGRLDCSKINNFDLIKFE